jgi:hypothetical protein
LASSVVTAPDFSSTSPWVCSAMNLSSSATLAAYSSIWSKSPSMISSTSFLTRREMRAGTVFEVVESVGERRSC